MDEAFPIISAESATPRDIPQRLVVAEIARELHLRRDTYPGRVAHGKLSPAMADWRIDVMAAIHADLNSDLHLTPPDLRYWQGLSAAADERLNRFTWAEIVTELQREISLRRRYYPQLVKDGQRPPVMLRHQLERIEAAHYYYWVQARRWWPAELDHKRYRGGDLTEAERQIYRDAYQRHRDRFVPIDEAPRGAYHSETDVLQEAVNG